MTSSGPVEIELKLSIDPTAAAALRAHPALRALARGRARTASVVSTYYDTPDQRLKRAGVALRLRRDGRRWLMTVKGAPSTDAASGIVSRLEFEWPLARPQIDAMRLATTPWRAVFAKALRKGGLVMQCATCPATFIRKLEERLATTGHELLDAPMSGGRARAESGELTFMSSGNRGAFAAAESILSATSAKVFRLGDKAGIGSLVKTVNQLLAGVHIATAAEAMALAAKAGADTRAVYEVISASAGNSWMFGNRVPHMLDDDYTPLSAIEIFVKDLGLVLDTGHEMRLPLPLAAAAHQLFIAAAGAGWGKLDDAAVVKVYEAAGDFKVSSPVK